MRIIPVNKPSDPIQLKLLFPALKIADGVPVYGKQLYRNFEYPISDKTELVLEQSNSGYNLDTHLGLLGFLRDVGYMSDAKIKRFEAAGKDRVVDSSGRVISPEGVFKKKPDVLNMYFYCSTLRVSNKVFVDEEMDAGYLLDVLEGSLYRRLVEVDSFGHEKFLERTLQLIDSFYSTDVKFTGRRDSRGVSGFDRMARLMSSFNLNGFKEFSLTDDIVEDTYIFLTLFN